MKHTGESYQEVRKKILGTDKKREAEIQLEAAKLELAEHLVEYREKKDMTQRELADKLGVRQQVVAKIENGSNITKLKSTLRRTK